MMPTLQLISAHHYFDFKGHGSWVEFLATSCFVFVCLFVCSSTPKVGDYFVFKSHKWVRFSCFFVFVLFCFVLFCFVLFLFFVFCFLCFSFKMFNFPMHHISRVRLIYFCCCFCFLFLSRRLVKFFAFFYFCYLLCFQKFHPLDIKWCALILILLHRRWWKLRHRQF